MSEFATTTKERSPIMDPVIYWRVTAFAVTAVALLGIVLTATNNANLLGKDFLAFDWSHNILHVVLALAAFLFGFANLPTSIVRTFAVVFGLVYAGLGVLGFFMHQVGPIHLELGENLVHLLIGAWGLVAGFGSKN